MGKIKGILQEVMPLTDRISSFVFAATGGGALPAWKAGAHVEFETEAGMRAYSLIPAGPGVYRIAVQREDDGTGGSRGMHAMTVGDLVAFDAPRNSFPVDTSQPAVLLAGGIGVTPLISMAASLQAAGQTYAFHYAGRSAEVMAYAQALADQHGEAFHVHCDDAETALNLDELIASVGKAHLYVCGPRGMLDAVRTKAEAAGVAPARLHFELFEAADALDGDVPFEVQINDGTVFTIPPGRSIIDVLEEHDIDVMYDCQRGDCGICQCDVLEGEPDHRDVVLSEAERAAGDVMQICVSRAKSSRLVLDIDGE